MVRALFITLLFLCFCAYTGFSQNSETQSNLTIAQAQLESGESQKALLTLEDMLVKDPSNLLAQEMKINILVQQEQGKEALRDVEEYILMYPDQPIYYYLRAILNLQKQKLSKSIEDFNTAISLEMPPEFIFKAYINRGMAYFQNQDYDLAEADFDEVVGLDSKNASAYHGRGMVKYELNQYEEAIVEFQKALKLEGENPITHYNIAMSYFRMDEDEKACYHFNESCALGHRNACRLLMMECDIKIPN